MRYLLMSILLASTSLFSSCESDPIEPSPTVLNVMVIVDADESPVPNARANVSAFARLKNSDLFGPERLERYEIFTDSTGSFELIIPGEINGEAVDKILMPYVSDLSGRLTQFDMNSFGMGPEDVILEGNSGESGDVGEYSAGQNYDFTIRLLR